MSLPNAGWDLHPQGLRDRLPGTWIGTLQMDCTRRTMQDFVERHQDVALDILASLDERLTSCAIPPCSAETAGWTTATAEELLEEVAEARALEMELRSVCVTSTESALRRRLLPFRMVPVCPQLIVFSSFLRVAEDFVGLVDFFEVRLARDLVFGNVRVVLAGELAECLLYYLVAGIASHAEDFVVVLELNGHDELPGDGSDR